MEGLRKSWRGLLPAAIFVGVLALPLTPAVICGEEALHGVRVAGEGQQPENRNPGAREKCKHASGSRAPSKDCPDGGERLPNDSNKRSPLDDAPPLTPLVA